MERSELGFLIRHDTRAFPFVVIYRNTTMHMETRRSVENKSFAISFARSFLCYSAARRDFHLSFSLTREFEAPSRHGHGINHVIIWILK